MSHPSVPPDILLHSVQGENIKIQLEELIDASRDPYGDYSIYEVMDLDRSAAIERMVEMYLAILDRNREWREPTLP